jgi:hypothetical protein
VRERERERAGERERETDRERERERERERGSELYYVNDCLQFSPEPVRNERLPPHCECTNYLLQDRQFT